MLWDLIVIKYIPLSSPCTFIWAAPFSALMFNNDLYTSRPVISVIAIVASPVFSFVQLILSIFVAGLGYIYSCVAVAVGVMIVAPVGVMVPWVKCS